MRSACRICVQGDQVGFFWNKDLEAWEGLGLVSHRSSRHLGPFSLGPCWLLPPGGKLLKWDGFRLRSGFCCLSPVPGTRQPLGTCFLKCKMSCEQSIMPSWKGLALNLMDGGPSIIVIASLYFPCKNHTKNQRKKNPLHSLK